MPLPFFNSFEKKRDQVMVVDLGAKVTKAVHISRKANGFTLNGFALVDAPAFDKGSIVRPLAEHLRAVVQVLNARVKPVSLAVGVESSLLRHADMPLVTSHDMRQMLKFSSKNYLQQDLSDCIFDVHVLPPKSDGPKGDALKGNPKTRVLVGAAKRQVVEDWQEAAEDAGLEADQIIPSFIGPANAFEMAQPEAFAKEVVALVDVGYKNTTICILYNGEFTLSRVVAFGSGKLTQGISEALGMSMEEAEGAKVTMPPEVESVAQSLLSPLGRELRASVDFHDHQRDRAVSQVFFSGGAARSPQIVQALQVELMVPCQTWNPTSFMTLALPPQLMGEIEAVAPQLTVAVGAGMAAF
ncbi:MAG: pilus assembly protein PilM [Verrucomicrobia bacterium]|nr:pilus assembly protein PilM [Verrucomicrobiota bacterium]